MKNLNSEELLAINGGHEGNSYKAGEVVGMFVKYAYYLYQEITK